jgi:hypothetical protein
VTGEEADAPLEALLHLGDEARLPDPRLASDGDDRASAFEEPVESLAQCPELLLATGERRFHACRRPFADAHDPESADGLASSFQLDCPKLLELEQVLDLARRRRPNDEVAECLQARRHVDGVAEGVVQDLRECVTLGDDHRTRIDRHADRELDPVGGRDFGRVACERLVERQSRPHRPLGVVLVRRRSPVQGQYPVPGQLRDRAAEALDFLPHQPHDLVEQELRPLRAQLLADRGRAGNVGDQSGHDPPLTGCHGHGEVLRRGGTGCHCVRTTGLKYPYE